MSFGILLINATAQVLSVNAEAQAMMHDGLHIVNGRVEADDECSHIKLAAAIAKTFAGGPRGKTRPLMLSRGAGRSSLLAQFAPLVAVAGAKTTLFDAKSSLAMIFLLDPASSLDINPALVADWFGLSPGEGRMAAEIARGHSPKDAAAKLGLTEGSARVILKRVFVKAKVSRQAELAALVARCHGLTMD